MVAFVNDKMTIVRHQVGYFPVSHEALDQRDINDTGRLAASAADDAYIFRIYIEKCLEAFHPLAEQLSTMDENKRIPAPLSDERSSHNLQWCSHRFGTGEAAHGVASLGLPGNGLGSVGLQFFELKFQLVEQPAAALGCRAKPVALVFGDQQLQLCNDRLGTRDTGFRRVPGRLLCRERGAQRIDVIRDRTGLKRHRRY